MDKEAACEMAMRRMAIGAVVLSTASLVSILLATPMLLTHIQTLQSEVMLETNFCKIRTRDMYNQLLTVDPAVGGVRRARQAGVGEQTVVEGVWSFGKFVPKGTPTTTPQPSFGEFEPEKSSGGGAGGYDTPTYPGANDAPVNGAYDVGVDANDASACGCTCMQGPPGAPGEPGDDGTDGVDGEVGVAGKSGRDGDIVASDGVVNEPCVICPPGPIGPPGTAGNKGPQGPRGAPGAPGIDGRRGEPGMVGPAGPMGVPGPEGNRGKKGEDGRVIAVNGPPGPVGQRGPQGRKGEKGSKGIAGVAIPGPQGPTGEIGRKGRPGRNGRPGPQGGFGLAGKNGSCDHCPPPRTPPGY